jgi:RNA polymerase sigma factor (sigma-70 family)
VLSAAELSDTELAQRVRDGDREVYGELWHRHADAGRAAARRVTDRFDADDLVQEAFARILETLGSGNGPQGAFRPYLYATIDRVAATWATRTTPTVPLDEVPEPSEHPDHVARIAEGGLLGRAYASLPPEWAEVLWYTELEEMGPAEVGPLLGLAPASASALAYRAREGLRRAWLQAHVTQLPERPRCRWVAERVGAYHRGALSDRARRRFETHVDGCADCPVLVAEVGDDADILVRARLRAVLWPAVLGAAALPGAGAGIAAGAPPARGVRRLGRGRRASAAAAAAALVLAVGGVAALAALTGRSGDPAPVAAEPADPAAGATTADPPASPVERAEPDLPPAVEDAADDPEHVPADVPRRPSAPSGPVDAAAPLVLVDDPVVVEPAAPVDPGPPVDPGDDGDDDGDPVVAPPVVTDVLAEPHYLPALSGTATPGAEVRVRFADGALAGWVTADESGAWRVAVVADVVAGDPVGLAVTQTVDGVTSAVAGPFGPFTPEVPVVLFPLEGSTPTLVALDGDGRADDLEVRFQGEPGLLVQAAVDGVSTGRTHELGTAPLVRVVHDLAPGPHTFAVRYADPARGLVGAWAVVAFTVG